MATLVEIDGFEHGVYNNSLTVPGGKNLYTLNSGTAKTRVTGRTHGYGIQVAQDGVTGQNTGCALSTATSVSVVSFYFKIVTLNTAANAYMWVWASASNNGFFGVNSDGTVFAACGASNQSTAGTYNDAAWHRIDGRITKGATTTIDWAVDGTAQTQVSVSDTAGGTITGWRVGSTIASDDLTFICDDLVLSSTSGDYPLGEYEVWALRPDGDGTHAGGSGGLAKSIGGTTNSYLAVDDDPFNDSDGDYLLQANNDGSDYLEITFANDAQGVAPDVVKGLVSVGAAGTAANNMIARFVDSGGTTLTDTVSGDVSNTDVRHAGDIIASPGGDGWTTTELDGVKFRFGFSTDANPDPYCYAVMLEYAIVPGGSQSVTPGLISHTATLYSPQVNQSVSMGLISHAATLYSPQVNQSVSMGLIDHTAALYDPTVTPGAVTVGAVDLLDHTASVFAPQINQAADLGVLTYTATLYAPQVNQSVAVGLIDHTAALYDPTVSTAGGPQTVTITAILDHTATLYAPTVNQAANMGLIDHTAALYAPQINQSVAPGLLDHTATVLAMQANQSVVVGLLDHTASVFAPQVNHVVSPGLIDHTAQVLTPTITGGGEAPTPSGVDYTWWF